MEQICIRCGNKDFSGIDTARPYSCPVPGCGWITDPEHPEWIVLRDSKSPDIASDRSGDWLSGWKEDGLHD